MQDFRKLVVWQKSHKLTLEVFALSAAFARPPYYALQNQAVRAAMSVPANLAEGQGERETVSYAGSPASPWVQRANLSIICFLPGISGWSRLHATSGSPNAW